MASAWVYCYLQWADKDNSSSFSARWAGVNNEDGLPSWITARAPDHLTVTGKADFAGRNAHKFSLGACVRFSKLEFDPRGWFWTPAISFTRMGSSSG